MFMLERLLIALSVCTMVVVALMLGLVAAAEYEGIPYLWPPHKIAFSACILLLAAGAVTYSTLSLTNALVRRTPKSESN